MGSLRPALAEVGVSMQHVVTQLEQCDVGLEEVAAYMSTDRFRHLFRVEGETLFCEAKTQ